VQATAGREMRPRAGLCRGGCTCDGSGVRLAGPPIQKRPQDETRPHGRRWSTLGSRRVRGAAAARKCARERIKNGREAGDARGRRRRLAAGYFVSKRVTGWSAGVPRRQSPGLGLHSDSSCVRLLLLCRKGRLPSLRHELHNVKRVNGMPASQGQMYHNGRAGVN